ncbi:MAG: FtsX-like permease family protein [Candidatus Contendobacter sp.]|nr:FtsX-like permease family protein [Candidatus Contendobacter sp.]MDS4058162.1 FtsX-like permease family protein [Candidatus Contendobacter sp.]
MNAPAQPYHANAKRRGGMMRFLALADLWHEWPLNLCLILALAAVLAPLLLLLGLKNGVVDVMRQRLVQDPVYRELKPQESLNLSPAWFETLAARPEVAFVIPTILRGSSVIRVGKPDSEQAVSMDLLPTGPGDVLLLENGGVIPQNGEVVLSADAAAKLGTRAGDPLRARITRSRAGRMETATADFKVGSVLSPRADAQQRVYAPLSFTTDVEIYREGRAVPGRNWPGGLATPYFSFDGAFVVAPEGLDTLVTSGLVIGTGFGAVEPVAPAEFTRRTGLSVADDAQVYDVRVLREPVQWASLQAVRDKLRGREVAVMPYVKETTLTLELAGGTPFTVAVVGLSPSPQDRQLLRIPELPWGPLKAETPFAEYAQLLLPAAMPPPAEPTVTATLTGVPRPVCFPLRLAGPSFNDHAVAPLELLATLRTAALREVHYSAEQNSLLLARAGYSGFRLYARGIDDVAELHRGLRDQGIETLAKVQDIERIRLLDQALTRLFWLVAVVGIVGGIAALVASLYAAVERKQRDIAMMRLLGLSRFAVSRFPVYQSAAIAALAAGLAILGFYTLAAVINTVFAAGLGLGARICQLPVGTLVQTLLVTVAAAVGSSLFAAWRTTLIEPAEAIRVE